VKELECEIDKIICIANELKYKFDVVNFYRNPKSDGYRGIHLYFKNNKIAGKSYQYITLEIENINK